VSTPTPPFQPLVAARPLRKGERTRERVLDVAEALFAERGYQGTALRDVAERVGLRIPSLYNHFPSKDSLYAAVLERGLRPVLELLARFVEAGRGTGWDSAELVTEVMALLSRRPNLPRLVQHETLQGGLRLTPLLRDWVAPIFERALEMAETSAAGTRWHKDQVPLLVFGLYQVVAGYFAFAPFYQELSGEDLLSRAALARQTRFLAELVDVLFADRGAPHPA
jgi:AcrR family transcriptional regulator